VLYNCSESTFQVEGVDVPKLELVSLSFYVRPSLAVALKKTASEWGCSMSDLVAALLRWGVRGIEIEALIQGQDDRLGALRQALSSGMQNWGLISPSASVPLTVKRLVDYAMLEDEVRVLAARLNREGET